jgi:hypothetical protein
MPASTPKNLERPRCLLARLLSFQLRAMKGACRAGAPKFSERKRKKKKRNNKKALLLDQEATLAQIKTPCRERNEPKI